MALVNAAVSMKCQNNRDSALRTITKFVWHWVSSCVSCCAPHFWTLTSLDRVPLSRAASTTLLTNQQFNGPVFDRQSQFVVRDPALNFKPAMIRRAQSMNDLRFPDAFFTSGLNWPLQRGLNGIQRPFNYLIQMPDQERNRVSIGAESDEIQRSYKDVAL